MLGELSWGLAVTDSHRCVFLVTLLASGTFAWCQSGPGFEAGLLLQHTGSISVPGHWRFLPRVF